MLYILALHLIFVVTWFSGLFYIVRLFVYHSEANNSPEPERSILIKHFKLAEKRLWYGITWPSAIGTYIFGLWLLFDIYSAGIPGWLVVKLIFVFALTIYHLICGRIFNKYKKGKINFSGMQMRMWNEVATIFLVTIIFIVVLKDLNSWLNGLIGLIAFSLVLLSAIKMYKRFRENNSK